MFGLEFGIIALIGLVLWIWAVISIVQSAATPMGKAIWIVLVLVLPFAGWIIWFFLGPKAAR